MTGKQVELLNRITTALYPYLPPGAASVRALPATVILTQAEFSGDNPDEELTELFGRRDEHENVTPEQIGEAITSVKAAYAEFRKGIRRGTAKASD